MALWEIEIHPAESATDREAERLKKEMHALHIKDTFLVRSAKSFLIQTSASEAELQEHAIGLLVDSVVETYRVTQLPSSHSSSEHLLVNVLFKPGVTDNVALSAKEALQNEGLPIEAVGTCRKYWFPESVNREDYRKVSTRLLANDAIEQVIEGPLKIDSISLGHPYTFQLETISLREMSDEELETLSKTGQLYLSLPEMQTIQSHFRTLDREPTDIELETLAQTWSEHCSHKTLAGRICYSDGEREVQYENMLKETIFAATEQLRTLWGEKDWCVSVFKDNAGIVTFDEKQNVCFKVETHNHPSALEPYGGANTGLGGVIRDPLGTGLGAKPVCNTDVFCFANPSTPHDVLPPGVLHPKAVLQGVVAGVRDYGNRMGIPTVNGAVYFDDRYLGNPLVYCGNVAMIPSNLCEKRMQPGDAIVAVGGRTGRDGIHGATFSSAELTEESEMLSGGAVQIGNAITEKMMLDVILQARDEGLYSSITDCGAGGFSSAVGEMGEESGAEVWLEQAPLKYEGLSYTEIWISEAQERMVLAVPQQNLTRFQELCETEGVEATVIGQFTNTKQLVLKYQDQLVGELAMEFLHDGRPPVVREARFEPTAETEWSFSKCVSGTLDLSDTLRQVLGSLNVASKEWIVRQYDHEVQAGSVLKPLVGIAQDGPGDAAVIRPDLQCEKGLVIACGMNPRYGDYDPYWMAASAIDEAVRNCVCVGADPLKIAILDNFCWGNTEKSEVLGSLVRAAQACYDVAIAYQTPFISGKDSLNNEFSWDNDEGEKQTVAIPATLLISALGQMDDVNLAVSMDLKEPGNAIYLVGETLNEMGGSHFGMVHNIDKGFVPQLNLQLAPKLFSALHQAMTEQRIRSCHDLSEGGLAVSLAEMTFSGGLGAKIDLREILSQSIHHIETALEQDCMLLFSESNSRFLIEVRERDCSHVEEIFHDLPLYRLGEVTDNSQLHVVGTEGNFVIEDSLVNLKEAWQSPLKSL